MSELHKFLFDGAPVRGLLVRLTDGWRELLARRGSAGGWPAPVRTLLGEMTAAATLLQSNLKFDGALVLQVHGDGPLKLAVAEARSDLQFRATAKPIGPVPDDAPLAALVDVHGRGRCAITLDPRDRQPGREPYQGIVPLRGDDGAPLASVADALERYMRQSEQLDSRLVLAADDKIAAGLMIQRLPVEGERNLGVPGDADPHEDYRRIATLAATLQRDELLALDAETLLRRLFWEEPLRLVERLQPRFACSCSRERVRRMLQALGRDEVESIVAEFGAVEIGCEFCGQRYAFDRVDAGELFVEPHALGSPPAPGGVH